jgi:hypothetical protein
LGPEKSGHLTEVSDKTEFRLANGKSNWPLLTGGRYSQVVIKSGLTVHNFNLICFDFNFLTVISYPILIKTSKLPHFGIFCIGQSAPTTQPLIVSNSLVKNEWLLFLEKDCQNKVNLI